MRLDSFFNDESRGDSTLPDDVVEGLMSREGFRPVSTEARAGLKQEILPSAPKENLAAWVAETTSAMTKALVNKDMLYTRLIRHKAIDQSEQTYWDDLVYLLTEWGQKQAEKEAEEEAKAREAEPKPEVSPSQALAVQENFEESLQDMLGPGRHVSPWRLTAALNESFREFGFSWAKAQVAPVSGWRLSSSSTSRKQSLVSVVTGSGIAARQVDLRFFDGQGWLDLKGEHNASTMANKVTKAVMLGVLEPMIQDMESTL